MTMTKTKAGAVILLFLVAAGFIILKMQGVSLRKIAGLEGIQTAPAGSEEESAPDKEAAPAVTYDHIRMVVDSLDKKHRQQILGDRKLFQQLAEQEARNTSLLAALRVKHVQDNPNVRFLMQRAADNVAREIYMNRLIKDKIPADFPNRDQIKQYYDNNKNKFRIGERLQIWQIFLPITSKMGPEEVKALESRADDIVKDIRTGKTSFAEAAFAYSTHEQSRINGGYMGLVGIKDLKPGINKALASLGEGKISNPVKTEDGLHILKKGATVPARYLALNEVSKQIRKLLVNQAVVKLREDIYGQVTRSYPVDLKASKIEEWRQRLRSRTEEKAVSQ